jgi:Uma2 family endonuclease
MRDVIGRYVFNDEQRKIALTLKLDVPTQGYIGGHKELPARKFTVEEFVRMGEAGIFEPDIRVELIDGVIVEMSGTGRPHARRTHRITRLFGRILPDDIEVSVQSTIRLNDWSGPEPDIALLSPEASLDGENIPSPEDILLIAEVADSSLRIDRGEKARRYAENGIRELWIFVLADGEIEVHRQPTPEGCADVQRYRRGDALTILALPDVRLAADDLLQ